MSELGYGSAFSEPIYMGGLLVVWAAVAVYFRRTTSGNPCSQELSRQDGATRASAAASPERRSRTLARVVRVGQS
jgi:hypothetical protein